jgi:cytochrome c biogenesis factor
MIPELGHFALILALCVVAVQGTLPLIGAHQGRMSGSSWRAPRRKPASC